MSHSLEICCKQVSFLLQTQTAEKLFSEGGQERRDKMAEERKRELKTLRQKLMAGNKDNLMDQFDDLLNASANKVKKTKVSIQSNKLAFEGTTGCSVTLRVTLWFREMYTNCHD